MPKPGSDSSSLPYSNSEYALANLGELLETEGDEAGAEPLLRRALDIDEGKLGPEHPIVAMRLICLAEHLELKGDNAGAEPLCRRALAINERVFGEDRPIITRDLLCLAKLAH